jgi:hypothetical protein
MKAVLSGAVLGLLVCWAVCGAARAGDATGRTDAETVREATGEAGREDPAETTRRDLERPWVFSLYAGVQYDDNITLRDLGVDAEGDHRTDWKALFAFQADWRPVRLEDRVLGLRYRAYQSFIDVNSDLELTGHTLSGYYVQASAPLVLFLPVSYSHYNLDWHRYLDVYSVAPRLYWEQSPHWVGVLRAEYARQNYFKVRDEDFDENDRDSDLFSVGVEEWYLFGPKAEYRLELGYALDRENCRAREWGSCTHRLRLGFGAQLPWLDLTTGAHVQYEAREYDAENPAFGEVEREDITTCGMSVSRPLWPGASATLSYVFTDNQSNVTSQDYERSQVTLGVTYRF